jgi:hypothetical protein
MSGRLSAITRYVPFGNMNRSFLRDKGVVGHKMTNATKGSLCAWAHKRLVLLAGCEKKTAGPKCCPDFAIVVTKGRVLVASAGVCSPFPDRPAYARSLCRECYDSESHHGRIVLWNENGCVVNERAFDDLQ